MSDFYRFEERGLYDFYNERKDIYLDKKALNNAWRFVKDKKELEEKVYFSYSIMDNEEYDEKDYCCQCSMDEGRKRCKKCGKKLGNKFFYHSGEKLKGQKITSVEQFMELYCKTEHEDMDIFDELYVYESIMVDKKLYNKCLKYAQKHSQNS